MNEEYLWDKSGEPDPEVQELEEILAPLRYQPKPLELPAPRRNNYLLWAIAASLLIALMAGSLWLKFRSQQPVQQEQAKSFPSVPSVFKEQPKNTDPPKTNPPRKRNRKSINQREHEEALAAKQQVMLALRLASEKLKLAQRRTQAPSPNQIKNQHRVG